MLNIILYFFSNMIEICALGIYCELLFSHDIPNAHVLFYCLFSVLFYLLFLSFAIHCSILAFLHLYSVFISSHNLK